METLSSYARQFIGGIERPDVDKIEGLSPSISIEQKTISHNPRSTVGTITEIYDFVRLLFARCGIQYSPDTGKAVTRQSLDQIFEKVMSLRRTFFHEIKPSEQNFSGTAEVPAGDVKITILSPLIRGRKGHYRELFTEVLADGFTKVRIDGEIRDITFGMKVERFKIHDIDVVIDRLSVSDKSRMRIYDSLEMALKYGDGVLIINDGQGDKMYNERLSDPETGRSFSEPAPNMFSFNSEYGWCKDCYGLGEKKRIDENRIFPDENLSYIGGGFAPIGKPKKTWIASIITGVLLHLGITPETPVKEFSKEVREILLYGTKEKINYSYTQKFSNSLGKSYEYSQKFNGITGYIEQVSRNTSSQHIRNWAEGFMSVTTCNTCGGGRLSEDALWVKIGGQNIHDISKMNIRACAEYFTELKFKDNRSILAKPIIKEISARLKFLLDVGLEYLTIDRSAKTLSGGEAQRIRLATQIGSQLTGVLYILDEPSIGLHQRDNLKLINSLKSLRDLGNSIIVVEHDREMIESSDYVVDLGPRAGEHGGEVVAAGKPGEINGDSITAEYLHGRKKILYNDKRRKGNGKFLTLKGAKGNNLRDVCLLYTSPSPRD